MQNHERDENESGDGEVMALTSAAGAIAFLFGFLTKFHGKNRARFRQRGITTVTAAATATFFAAGFGSSFDAHRKSLVHGFPPTAGAAWAGFAATMAMTV